MHAIERPTTILYRVLPQAMFSVVARRVFPKVVASTPKAFAFRAFSEKLTIPTDNEQQYGRRKEEMEAEAAGDVGFNRDPIIPPDEAGTKENPILVSGVIAWLTSCCFKSLYFRSWNIS